MKGLNETRRLTVVKQAIKIILAYLTERGLLIPKEEDEGNSTNMVECVLEDEEQS